MLTFASNLFKLIERNKINLLYFLAFSMPLQKNLSTYLLIFVLGTSFFGIKQKKIELNLVLLPLLYALYMLSLTYSENFSFKFFEQKAAFIGMPLIFLNLKPLLTNIVISRLLKSYILGCFISVLLCFIMAIFNSISFNNGFVFSSQINPSDTFWVSAVKDGNYFFGNYFSLFHQTVYFTMFLTMAIGLLLFNKNLFTKRPLKWVLLLVFSISVFLVSSRAGILVFLVLIFIYLINKIKKRKHTISSLVILSIIVISFFSLNPRTKKLLNNLNSKEFFHRENSDSFSLRLMSWDASLAVIKENPILGVGVGDAYDELKFIYKRKRYVTPFRQRLNSHNQFLQIAVETGIFGLLIYLLLLFNIWKSKGHTHFYPFLSTVFLFIMVINSFFESVFNQYSGLLFFNFFYCLIFVADIRSAQNTSNG